jgi:Raf kinase inhibitor-like YbhB/YbcL family protein
MSREIGCAKSIKNFIRAHSAGAKFICVSRFWGEFLKMLSWNRLLIICGCLFLVAPSGCSGEPKSAPGGEIKLQVSSPAFSEGQPIPQKYTCDGNNISPPLAWTQPPADTKSMALIVEDVDAPGGVFTHWILYNLPAKEIALAENIARTATLNDGGKQGKNSFGKIGYSGPCPPPGKPHRYYFKIYALDVALKLLPAVSREDLLAAMNNHVVAEGQLMGTYGRSAAP